MFFRERRKQVTDENDKVLISQDTIFEVVRKTVEDFLARALFGKNGSVTQIAKDVQRLKAALIGFEGDDGNHIPGMHDASKEHEAKINDLTQEVMALWGRISGFQSEEEGIDYPGLIRITDTLQALTLLALRVAHGKEGDPEAIEQEFRELVASESYGPDMYWKVAAGGPIPEKTRPVNVIPITKKGADVSLATSDEDDQPSTSDG